MAVSSRETGSGPPVSPTARALVPRPLLRRRAPRGRRVYRAGAGARTPAPAPRSQSVATREEAPPAPFPPGRLRTKVLLVPGADGLSPGVARLARERSWPPTLTGRHGRGNWRLAGGTDGPGVTSTGVRYWYWPQTRTPWCLEHGLSLGKGRLDRIVTPGDRVWCRGRRSSNIDHVLRQGEGNPRRKIAPIQATPQQARCFLRVGLLLR